MSRAVELAGQVAVSQNVLGIAQFLLQYPPFDQMEPAHLLRLVEGCRLRFYAAGQVIAQAADGQAKHWYLIRQGAVQGHREGSTEYAAQETFTLLPGDAFPIAALLGERATRTIYSAAHDTFCLQLDAAEFFQILRLSEPLRAFSLSGVSSLLEQLHNQVQAQAIAALGADYSLNMRLQDLLARAPVTCAPDTPLSHAVRLMHEKQVGSIAVTTGQHLAGIFTLRDLRREIASESVVLKQPISLSMTPDPFVLPTSATAFDAAMLMTQHRIGHVCVVDEGMLKGVVSERDLFALQRVDLVHLARAVRHADSVGTLQGLRQDITRMVSGMMAHGADSAQVTRVITQLNDHSTHRVIELMLQQHGDPGFAFSWLAFGSEGRGEQTLLTDQDNGILFLADSPEQAAERRLALLPLAQAINQALDRCGLTLCKGNIMAGNPALCLSADEWHSRFSGIIRQPEPENVLQASIFFDIRRLWGDDNGYAALLQNMLTMVADHPQFQRLMAQAALSHRPPSTGMRDILSGVLGVGFDGLDLKTEGLTLFVDGARLLALAHGISEASTLERFRLLADKGVISAQDAQAYDEAYRYLQLLRMQQHQKQAGAGLALSNQLAPASLGALDKRILREALRQARDLQQLLRFKYRL